MKHLAIHFFILLCLFSNTAQAAITIESVSLLTVDGDEVTSVTAGDNVNVKATVTVTMKKKDQWEAISYRFDDSTTSTCDTTVSKNGKGTYEHSFTTTISSTETIYFNVYQENNCNGTSDETTLTALLISPDAFNVTINEIDITAGIIELYFNEETDISDWSIKYVGSGNNNGEMTICDSTSTTCVYSAGTFLSRSGFSLHNTLQEVLLLDSDDNAVHYFRYANNSASSDIKWTIETDSTITTTYYNTGKETTICAVYDGEDETGVTSDAWAKCEATQGSTNNTNFSPVTEYRFEDDSWSGTSYDVTDETGGYNALAQGGISTSDTAPAISGDTGTCGYAVFDGEDDYIELPDSLDAKLTGSFTVTAWIKPSNLNSGSRIFIDDENNGDKGYGLSLGDGGGKQLRFYSRNVNPVIVDTANSLTNNTWIFVTAVHDSEAETRQIYINGIAQKVTGGDTSNTYTGTWGTDSGPTTIGGETKDSAESSNRFTGSIDEVRVYNSALSTSQINVVYNETHDCPDSSVDIDHYKIVHDGNGLTCEDESVTITAHQDDHSIETSYAGTINLSTSKSHGDWSLVTGSGTLTNSGNGVATYAYATKDNGSVILELSNSNAETINIDVLDGDGITEDSSEDADLVFANAGFRFLYSDSNALSIANQTAGTAFPETLKLQAVENVQGVCTALFSGSVAVDLSQSNVSPTGIGGLSFTIDGTKISKSSSSPTSVKLTFDDDSIATISSPIYNDAGQISLQADYNVGGVSLTGNSNSFWVSPSYLSVSAQSGSTTINGTTASSNTTHKAEDDFTLTVKAYNSKGDVTPNYSPGNMQFKLARTGPLDTGSVDGALIYADSATLTSALAANADFTDVSLSSFTDGLSTYSDANYSEVGLLNLDIQDSNYGSQGITIDADAIDIGRFTPAYFEITSTTDGALNDGDQTTSDVGDFVYTGQMINSTSGEGKISYTTLPEFIITAKASGGATTQNYIGSFMKLEESGVERVTPTKDSTQIGADNTNKLNLTADLNSATLTALDGMVNYQFNAADNYVFTREKNALIAPFTADIDLHITSITDDDGITIKNDDGTTPAAPVITLQPTGIEIRFGRWNMDNSYGPETTDLRMPMQVQYWNGSTFVTNEDDSFTTFGTADATITGGTLSASATSVSGSGSFTAGEANTVTLSAPNPSSQGNVTLSLIAPSWLQYDWFDVDSNNDGPYTEDPSAQATFGLYRGNDRIIYRGEVFD